jgi:hypothetical protein
MTVDTGALGPKYAITVLTNGTAVQVYDVYPQSSGGPRAHRPAAQPGGKTTEAWFYAPVSLPGLMHAAGIPLVDPSATGQTGTMEFSDPAGYVPRPQATTAPSFTLSDAWDQERRALLASAGAALFVLLLLFAAARFGIWAERRRSARPVRPGRRSRSAQPVTSGR